MHDTRASVSLGYPTYTLLAEKPSGMDLSTLDGGHPVLQDPAVEAVQNNRVVDGNGHGLRQRETRPD